ncbi:cell division protein FtsQ/DivIB [Croceibacterium aestuarii]|uniref:cell division protein FtsQ/DivIB n=1 Tax=Croceibacterium aestuarii TaxID=3064139 RepID=UPI00272E273C|nr:cell division protein FtsQ/DivIB [Croceibacterium sp. D39]
MAQTIRRKQTGVRRQARAQGTKRQVRKARAQTSTLVDALMRVLPFTEEQLHRFFLFLILLGAAVGAWFVASLAGLNILIDRQFAAAAANAGFEVDRVEVHGVKRMNELKVYERVLGARDRAMPQVDLDELRASLLGLNWVEDARVSRQLPDTIVIDIVERTPHAVLAKPDRLVLIDGTGHELEPISRANAKGLLKISGPGAQAQVESLTALLDAAPALRPQVAAAEWIGNRRWNLTFKSGQLLSLPMGDKDAAGALINFARLDGVHRLLGGKVVAFDMRSPDRIYMRCPDCKETDKPDFAGGVS